MLTDLELGWLAGIIDGEGCIWAEWSNRRRERGGSLCILVQVEACSDAMMNRVAALVEMLGVKFYFTKQKKRAGRNSHQVLIKKKSEVLKFLRVISPHLVVKQTEANLAIWYYERWGDQRCHTHSAPVDERILVFDEMRRLKKIA